MPKNTEKKYRQIIDYVEDNIGADINRDLVKMALVADDLDDLGVDLVSVSGTSQSANDISAAIVELAAAVKTNDADELISRITDSSGTEIDPATNQDQPNWLDDDILNHDLIASGDYTLAESNIRGTGDFIIKVASDDAAQFSITVEWTDGGGNVLYSQQPAEANTVTDAALKFNVASDHVQVTISDDSGGGQNIINGSVNAH